MCVWCLWEEDFFREMCRLVFVCIGLREFFLENFFGVEGSVGGYAIPPFFLSIVDRGLTKRSPKSGVNLKIALESC